MAENFKNKVGSGTKEGLKKGWSGFVWMLKILVPISFLTALIQYSGVISRLDYLLKPAMDILSLSPIATLPLIVGMLTGIYGGIASMIVLPLTIYEMTLIANFLLISHNLIQEGVIQGKSGLNPVKATIFRLMASVITVLVISIILKPEAGQIATAGMTASSAQPFATVLEKWLMATVYLGLKIFFIIMTLMLILELMKVFNIIDHLVRMLTPLLKAMGLNKQVGILWLTATIFGLAYGGAVIVEEAKEGAFTKPELEKLHLSIGINHSMVEDPALFLSLGLNPFWLWIPRFITALIAVRLYNLYYTIRPYFSKYFSLIKHL